MPLRPTEYRKTQTRHKDALEDVQQIEEAVGAFVGETMTLKKENLSTLRDEAAGGQKVPPGIEIDEVPPGEISGTGRSVSTKPDPQQEGYRKGAAVRAARMEDLIPSYPRWWRVRTVPGKGQGEVKGEGG
jgi:hypothetical protein